ncbi:MAG TPA: PRC-barrel domain-containing protein [Chloroflexota bacterium]|nr:PRC-barrel domain-containing protein [Chloroflexota bacterium]
MSMVRVTDGTDGRHDGVAYRQKKRRLTRLRGMPVIDLSNARRMGYVADVLVDPNVARVTGMRVGPSGEFPERYIPSGRIRRIGQQAVVLAGADATNDGAREEEDSGIEGYTLVGLEVMADSGDRVGFVSEVYIDADTLGVEGYALAVPLWRRLLTGRRIIAPEQVSICSRDLMIVPSMDAGYEAVRRSAASSRAEAETQAHATPAEGRDGWASHQDPAA